MITSMDFIPLKEGANLINKSVVTIRRIYSLAPSKHKKKVKGITYIDSDYLLNHKPKQKVNMINHNDNIIKILEAQNGILNKRLDEANVRQNEANQIMMQQAKTIDSLKMLPPPAPAPVVDHIDSITSELNTPLVVAPVKKMFPLMEVMSIGISVIFLGLFAYVVLR